MERAPMSNRRIASASLWLIASAALPHAGQAQAARQGSLGSKSSGTISISVSVAAQARVSGARDVEFTEDDSEGVQIRSRDICMSSNSLARSFRVAAIGSGPEGALELSSGSDTLAYSVQWSLPENPNPASLPATDAPSGNIDTSPSQLECRSGTGLARMTVALDDPRPRSVKAHAPYTGTLTLLLSPE
jgi:hypothetical protein